jgi:putative NADPH-quinone reductase
MAIRVLPGRHFRRPTRALVVYCHPSPTSYVAALRDRVLVSLDTSGAEHRLIDLYADGFTPEFSATERVAHLDNGTDPAICGHAESLQWCNTLILVYPTWWGSQPAMLKGWFDRVFVSGVAWDPPAGANRLRPRLHNLRRIVAVTTHGSPKHINMLEGEGGKRTVTRALRPMGNRFCRTSWLAIYNIDRSTYDARVRFLGRTEKAITALTRSPAV